MKKGFTRTYWFLLAVWLLSSLAAYGLRRYIDAAYRYPADYLAWLRAAACLLLVLCVCHWWERKPEAAEPAAPAPAPPEEPDSLS